MVSGISPFFACGSVSFNNNACFGVVMFKESCSLCLFSMNNIGRLFIIFLLAAVAAGCSSTPQRQTGLDLQREVRDSKDKPQFLISSTKHVDSAQADKVVFDLLRIEYNKYPDTVKLFARVFDSLGNFITNMAPPYREDAKYFTSLAEKLKRKTFPVQNFTVREFGDQDSIPYSVMLTVDYSGSMSGVFDALKEGTEMFIGLKQPQDRIGIATFSRDFRMNVPFSSDKGVLLSSYRATANQSFGYYSALYDGIARSIEKFADTPPDVPRVLVVFSDGDDNYSKSRLRAIIDSAKSSNVNIFTVAFGYANDTLLQAISNYTGGKFYHAYTKEELKRVFLDIYRSLRNFYRITYHPPEFIGKHLVTAQISLPGRDSISAKGMYDTGPFYDVGDILANGDSFSYKILFDFNKADIRPESMHVIEELAAILQEPRYMNVWLEVQGHTDNVGSEEANMKLSEMRAVAVVTALTVQGVEHRRLVPRGFGFTQPVAPNDTEENRQKNRRTQFVVLRK